MKISRENLYNAANEGLLDRNQADTLFDYLETQPGGTPFFSLTNVLYYFGSSIAIGAMTLFMNLGWEQFGGWGIMFIAILYAGIGLLLTERFRSDGHDVPAGICATFAGVACPCSNQMTSCQSCSTFVSTSD